MRGRHLIGKLSPARNIVLTASANPRFAVRRGQLPGATTNVKILAIAGHRVTHTGALGRITGLRSFTIRARRLRPGRINGSPRTSHLVRHLTLPLGVVPTQSALVLHSLPSTESTSTVLTAESLVSVEASFACICPPRAAEVRKRRKKIEKKRTRLDIFILYCRFYFSASELKSNCQRLREYPVSRMNL